MHRSLGFGSLFSNYTLCLIKNSNSLSLRFHLIDLSLLEKKSNWPIMQKVHNQTIIFVILLLNIGIRFLVLFTPIGVYFTFPSQYSYAIGY